MMFEAMELSRKLVEELGGERVTSVDVPYIQFPASWEVKVGFPFAGACARFRVRIAGASQDATVSVYYDTASVLGCCDEPYYGIYPDVEGDAIRFFAGEIPQMLEEIQASLDKQLSNQEG